MTIIRPNSISGINSITAKNTDQMKLYDSNGAWSHVRAGVITATTFVGNLTGNVTGTASQLETNATGANLTLSGNLGVGGTITYEDVARVDATGISTFREGFKLGPLAGIALTAYADGSIRTTGIITATNLKVGPSNSTRPISIYSASDAQIQFQGSGTGTSNGNADGLVVGNSGGVNATLWNYENGYIRFAANNAERLRITSDGDLLIGTTTNGGGNRLYVVDNFTDAYVNPSDSILRIENANTSGTTGQASISFTSKTSSSNADSAIVSQAEDASGNARLEFWTDTANGMTEKMTITSKGSVGIGTVTPGNMCDNKAGLHIHSTSNDSCRLSLTTPNKPNSRMGYFGLNRFGIDAHNGFEIRDPSASYATRFLINNNGIITKPSQPSFRAYHNTSSNFSSGATVVWGATESNQGNCYDTSNGHFTAPVTGYYWFAFTVKGQSVGDTVYCRAQRSTNGGSSWSGIGPALEFHNDILSAHTTASFGQQLNASDKVRIGSATNVRIDGSNGWSGFLTG